MAPHNPQFIDAVRITTGVVANGQNALLKPQLLLWCFIAAVDVAAGSAAALVACVR